MSHVSRATLAAWWVAGWTPPMLPRTIEMWNRMTPLEKENVLESYHEYFGTAANWGGAPAWGETTQYEGTLDWWGRFIQCTDDPGSGCYYDVEPENGDVVPPPDNGGGWTPFDGGGFLLLAVVVIGAAVLAGSS